MGRTLRDNSGQPLGTAIALAAPDGFVTVHRKPGATRQTFADQSVVGLPRSLGAPMDHNYEYYVGAHQLMLSGGGDFDDGSGQLMVMSFDHPGVWHTLIESVPGAEFRGALDCRSVTDVYVACQTFTPRFGHEVVRLAPLDGSAAFKTTEGCPNSDLVVDGDSAAWVTLGGRKPACRGRHVVVMSRDGTVTVTKYRSPTRMIIGALGGAVFVDPAGNLELITTAGS
jgi:hypothetical protein